MTCYSDNSFAAHETLFEAQYCIFLARNIAARFNSRLGYAVNFIAPPAPGQTSPPELYRPPAERWLAHLADTQPRAGVTVLRGYGLPEYTLLVRPAH